MSEATSFIGRFSTETVEAQREREAVELARLRLEFARANPAWIELGELTPQGRYRVADDGAVYRLALSEDVWGRGFVLSRVDASIPRYFREAAGSVVFYHLVQEAPETPTPPAKRRRLTRGKA